MGRKGITAGRINRFFGILMAILMAVSGLLYYQGSLSQLGWLLIALIALIGGILFVFGVRTAQKDGFLDGYTRAKNHSVGKKQ